MRRGFGGWLVLCALAAACESKRSSPIDVACWRSSRFERGARVLEYDRFAPLCARAPSLVLERAGLSLALTATGAETGTRGWTTYSLEDAPAGDFVVHAGAGSNPVAISIAAELWSRDSDVLGYRVMLETPRGLVREFGPDALPFFRLRADSELRPSVRFDTDRGSFPLEIEEVERRGAQLIFRTAPPKNPIEGTGELRFGDRSWPASWLDRTVLQANLRKIPEAGLRRNTSYYEGRDLYDALVAIAAAVRRRGDDAEYTNVLLEAGEVAEKSNLPSEASRMWRAAAYTHLYARRFADAEPLLRRAEAIDRKIGNVTGIVRAANYRGLMETQLGRYRAARKVLAEGIALAESHGLDRDRAFLSLPLAELLEELGRTGDALRIQRSVAADFSVGSDADVIGYLIGLGWAELRAIETHSSTISFADPKKHLENALALARAKSVPHLEGNALANLAWLAYLAEDDRASDRLLAELAKLPNLDTSFARLFVPFARAQARLRQRRFAEAARGFEELHRLALLETARSDYAWRATHGLAEVHSARGDRAKARALFLAAIDELELVAGEADLSESRALFIQDRRKLFDAAIELELAAGRTFEAFMIGERARTQVLEALRAKVYRERLDISREYLQLRDRYEARSKQRDLVAPRDRAAFDAETKELRAKLREMFDAAHDPRPRPEAGAANSGNSTSSTNFANARERVSASLGDSAAIFTLVRVGTRTDTFFVTSREALHQRGPQASLLAWSQQLQPLHHLYVLAGGNTGVRQILDELEREPDLLRRTKITFLTHAASLFADDITANGPPLVVADPDSTLPGARREGTWVAAKLGAKTLTGPDATRKNVLAAIDGASVFHFAGHGVLHPAQPWDAHLVLADRETSSLEDLLIAEPKLGVVILSGCDTGELAPLSDTEQIGLPHAFLLGGARAVLATTRAGGDGEAFDFVRRFYEAGGANDPAEAWRRVATELAARGDQTWKSFYVMGRR